MNPSTRALTLLGFLLAVLAVPACDAPAPTTAADNDKAPAAKGEPAAKAVEAKKTPLNKQKTLFLEVLPTGERRVLIESEVCLREGQLELLLTRKQTKEHEAILSADVDARAVHSALLAAGAKAGTPVRYQPDYKPATGSQIKVTLAYEKDGKPVTVNAREWVRRIGDKKDLDSDWVFPGSQLIPDPFDKDTPPAYAANQGDLICVSNFPTAMLDLPINSPKDAGELAFDAHTDRIPPLKSKVTVILEPVPDDKKDEPKK
jgi:hypothetical protein